MPLISVLMPVHNGACHLRESVESILSQTYGDFEFLIVDDASTDRTANILASYKDPRIRTVRNPANLGVAKSLNAGVAIATGEYLARQDADDISRPDRLFKQLDLFQRRPDVVLAGSRGLMVTPEGRPSAPLDYPTDELSVPWRLLFRNCIAHSSVMIRMGTLIEEGGYSEDPRFSVTEDYELWSRMMLRGAVVNHPSSLLRYRVNPTSISCLKERAQKQQAAAISDRNLARLLGTGAAKETMPLLRRFIASPPGGPAFSAEEVSRIAEAFTGLQVAFYKLLSGRPGRMRHRVNISFNWAKHAAGLALKSTSGCDKSARLRLASWSTSLMLRSLEPMAN